ncbi:AAA family ATPase (plasmid) [Streptomyces decoyicus]|uniref:AAA family ATPase n=1 Tax=Streptomyces decoyicus TaxID=249567 RepID=UPI002E2FC82E|nr:AAA family ATPase [Streptomyces decoyicus]
MFTQHQPALVALIGPSGSGKSTIARSFPRGWRFELDAFRELVAGDGGDQASTPDALAVFNPALDARLRRQLPVVIDATSVEPVHRMALARRARDHRMKAVAIVCRTPLETCQDRQRGRSATRQVPDPTIAWQHAGVPTVQQLQDDEGFAAAYYADELDLMGVLLRRSAQAQPDPFASVRAAFGDDLADVFTWHPDPDPGAGFDTGIFAVAGQELVVRWYDDGDPCDHHWQARTACPDGCPGPAWVRVTSAADLLTVYCGNLPDDEPWCDGDECDADGTEG